MSQMHADQSPLEFDILDRLAKSLRVSGMKPGDMATALDVHRNTVGNYLNGRTKLDRRTLVAWAFACAPEVTVEWLESGTAPNNGDNDPLRSSEHPTTEEYCGGGRVISLVDRFAA